MTFKLGILFNRTGITGQFKYNVLKYEIQYIAPDILKKTFQDCIAKQMFWGFGVSFFFFSRVVTESD